MSGKPESVDDLLKRLQDLGVQPDQWREVESRSVQPDVVGRSVTVLTQLRDFLEKMLAQDQAQIASLREQLHRLKHGGGS
jgi:chromosome condensin MukBEF ATPase and DNA-binding subunit MukB